MLDEASPNVFEAGFFQLDDLKSVHALKDTCKMKVEGLSQAPFEMVLGRNCHGCLHNDEDADADDDDGDDDHAMVTKSKSRISNNTK